MQKIVTDWSLIECSVRNPSQGLYFSDATGRARQ
jgi:hypothetical protein